MFKVFLFFFIFLFSNSAFSLNVDETIKNTISVILDKTFTSNRAQAASMATKNRWI